MIYILCLPKKGNNYFSAPWLNGPWDEWFLQISFLTRFLIKKAIGKNLKNWNQGFKIVVGGAVSLSFECLGVLRLRALSYGGRFFFLLSGKPFSKLFSRSFYFWRKIKTNKAEEKHLYRDFDVLDSSKFIVLIYDKYDKKS